MMHCFLVHKCRLLHPFNMAWEQASLLALTTVNRIPPNTYMALRVVAITLGITFGLLMVEVSKSFVCIALCGLCSFWLLVCTYFEVGRIWQAMPSTHYLD